MKITCLTFVLLNSVILLPSVTYGATIVDQEVLLEIPCSAPFQRFQDSFTLVAPEGATPWEPIPGRSLAQWKELVKRFSCSDQDDWFKKQLSKGGSSIIRLFESFYEGQLLLPEIASLGFLKKFYVWEASIKARADALTKAIKARDSDFQILAQLQLGAIGVMFPELLGFFNKPLETGMHMPHRLIHDLLLMAGEISTLHALLLENRIQLKPNNNVYRANILRKLDTPAAKQYYADMLGEGQTTRSFVDEQLNDQNEINAERARLLREIKNSVAKYNYAYMLDKGQTKRSFDDARDLNDPDAINIEMARLLREANFPEAKYNYAVQVLERKTNLAYDGVTELTTTSSRYEAINNLCNEIEREKPNSKSHINLLRLHMRLLQPPSEVNESNVSEDEEIEKVEEEIVRTCEESMAQGDAVAEEFFDQIKKEFADKDEVEAPLVPLVSQATDLGAATPAVRESKAHERVIDGATKQTPATESATSERKEHRSEPSITKGQLRRQRLTEMMKTYHKNASFQADTPSYKVLYEEDVSNGEYNARIKLLIKSILDRGNEGHPEMLKGKRHPDGRKLFSRTINGEDRLIYSYDHAQKTVIIRQAVGHYRD